MVRALDAGLIVRVFALAVDIVLCPYFILFFNFYFVHKICPEVGGDTIEHYVPC